MSDAITVIAAPPFATIQDLGRVGFRDSGVPVSGLADRESGLLLNAILGNDPNAAMIEWAVGGGALRFDCAARIAVGGAESILRINGVNADPWLPIVVASGDELKIERIVRDRGRIFPLSVNEIAYLKADAKYTAIAARGQTFLVRIGISELEAQLDPGRFIRIHRSALVNLDFVDSMRADDQSQLEITMRDGAVLTASREASKVLREMAI